MEYTQSISITQTQSGYTLTVESLIDEQPITTTLNFDTAEELKSYVFPQIEEALAREVIAQQQAKRWENTARAWFRELNGVSQNDYYTQKRPEIIEWMQGYHWRYRAPGEDAVDCELLSSGFLRRLENPANVFRLTPDNRRRWEGRQPGGDLFTLLSSDQEFWRGTDANGETHIIRRIKKQA
jgi:hypothetical protein